MTLAELQKENEKLRKEILRLKKFEKALTDMFSSMEEHRLKQVEEIKNKPWTDEAKANMIKICGLNNSYKLPKILWVYDGT